MAAVAGAVAQALVVAYRRPGINRAWVNNGGDIALHLAPGQSARLGLYADLARFDEAAAIGTAAGQLRTDAAFSVHAAEPARERRIATETTREERRSRAPIHD